MLPGDGGTGGRAATPTKAPANRRSMAERDQATTAPAFSLARDGDPVRLRACPLSTDARAPGLKA